MMDSNPFVGTWKLVAWEITQPDGTIRFLYGKNVVGYLLYTADGYMSAEIMDPDRQQSDPDFPLEIAAKQTLGDADRARAYSTYLSYCGTYTVEGDTVTHHVKAGLIPSWTGSEQPRRFRFDQGRLIIGSGTQKLIWESAVKHA
jgi:hypothetical protein